jgi:aldehyde dehydrogenase (NAD+)
MVQRLKFYIDGAWQDSGSKKTLPVVNPATEEALYEVALGSAADVDKAVAAARRAFETFSLTTREQRVELLAKVIEVYKRRLKDIGAAISDEMGAPLGFAERFQAGAGLGHLMTTLEVLKTYPFEERLGSAMIVREPVGVVGMITPWNWPINQIACKVAPALAAGCTMVLKPSEIAPLSGILVAEILDAAGVPPGVFNLVNGDGPTVGNAISSHPGIDMVSFTGSTRAGVQVAINAAPTVKRVTQELGGKSANIILDDAEFQTAVSGGVNSCFMNSGQSCNAPTRMLVPAVRQAEAVAIAKAAAERMKVGDPFQDGIKLGPVVSEAQFNKIQGLIQKGIDEGAELVTGGVGRPDGLATGFYVKPTVFAGVRNSMTIAREEIFGPVLAILPYDTEEQAIQIANDTPYGLSGYVSSGDLDRARRVAARLRTGNVHLNGAGAAYDAPFGGYKQSGNGREWGVDGFEEFLETKAVLGYTAKS